MKVGIVGLGLMGGSAARTYHNAGWSVFAYNRSLGRLEKAISDKIVDSPLDAASIPSCDLIILANPLDASIKYLEDNAKLFNSVVVDFCGTKEKICKVGAKLSQENNFIYFGTHPMCGTNKSGYENSLDLLYENAPIAVCTNDKSKGEIDKLKSLLAPLKFAKFIYCTPQEHDRIIACTSQMAHCITTSFVKSPTANKTLGIKSGGFRDMTRLATLVPSMWAELMVSNRDNLTSELDLFIKNIKKLKKAIRSKDTKKVEALLEEGRKAKEIIDAQE